MTYLVGGLGASILKAGLPLWDGTDCPVAAIKVTRQNLYGVSLLHESGHQVAQLTGWTEELASAFRARLVAPSAVTDAWAGWASEIVADTHAFVHSGFASVATLHDVVAGENSVVFRHIPGDPHPIRTCASFWAWNGAGSVTAPDRGTTSRLPGGNCTICRSPNPTRRL